jgi:hypothetical protein
MNSDISAADLNVGRQRVHYFSTPGCSIGLIYENVLLFFFCTEVDRVWMLSIAATDCSLTSSNLFHGMYW